MPTIAVEGLELHLDCDPPYVITPVEDMGAVERALPKGYFIGDAWWSSSPDQKQPDGRWLLYASRYQIDSQGAIRWPEPAHVGWVMKSG